MSYRGDIRLGDTLDIKFTTRQLSGSPFTLAGSPVVSAYIGNGTTPVTTGITLTTDFNGKTGLNHVRVVASSGNGFSTGTDVQLVITTGTVNSVSVVGEEIAEFSIEKRSALMPATAGRTLVVDAAGLADANTVKVGPSGSGTAQTARNLGQSVLLDSGTGPGQIILTSGKVDISPTGVQAIWDALTSALTTAGSIGKRIADNLIGTLASGTHIPQTGDSFERIGTPVGLSISADIADVKTDTSGIKTKTDNLPAAVKKNTALSDFEFLLVDSSDHVTPKTGLTVTATRSINGAAFAACANSVTEVSSGVYKIDLAASDLNGTTIMLKFSATGADSRYIQIITQA